jgi:hypothetical protein
VNWRATTRLFEIDRLTDRLKPDSTEHLVIIEAIERGDLDVTRATVATHIESLISFTRDYLGAGSCGAPGCAIHHATSEAILSSLAREKSSSRHRRPILT